MRRRLALQALAVTSLVVISFTVPLLFLVRRQALERGQVEAERQAQTTAGLVALAAAGAETFDRATLENTLGNLPEGVGIVLPDGSTIGDSPSPGEVLATVRLGTPAAGLVGGSWQVGIPVATRHGLMAAIASVPESDLSRGVVAASIALILLGLLVIGAAWALARRMGRDLVRPVDELADVATRLGQGDLGARAQVTDPVELASVGRALNQLSGRLQEMLRAERESLADLSHQLRTPLAGLKLAVERLPDGDSMMEAVDRMQNAVDSLIKDVRTGTPSSTTADLRSVMVKRVTFWRVLAEEQGRSVTVADSMHPLVVAIPEDAVGSIADTLIENVLTHTQRGVAVRIGWEAEGDFATLRVEDAGPGFSPGFDPTTRGVSSRGSTGLGLDIVRKTAEAAGGSLRWGRSQLGGALAEVSLPLVK
ncbi:MAG TPA: HAMP domain-containing sensor histidine kinase [Acidimicrobiia bacterium]|nr:HAMP domain-containing sensor histidine kinase [Acidimicrobiia bacterium]